MYEDIIYKKPYLKEVVARIDFVTPISGLEKNVSTKIVQEITKNFPIAEPSETVAQHFQIGTDEVKTNKILIKQFNFFGKEREKKLVIAQNCVFVNYYKYSSYEDLKNEFQSAVNAIEYVHPGSIAARFGLRYINNIDSNGIKQNQVWKKLISENLLIPFDFFAPPGHLTRLFHVAELKFGDIDLRFQFGFPNPDFPAIMKRLTFVSDLDAYIQLSHPLIQSIQYMDSAHEHIQKIFENSITAELRKRMNA
jgi:uncharacterized protein (TIGR04255 family)